MVLQSYLYLIMISKLPGNEVDNLLDQSISMTVNKDNKIRPRNKCDGETKGCKLRDKQHVICPSAQLATHRRKPEKFPRPTVGVDETREGWDTFELNWVQYKEHAELEADEVSRQLVACCSKELQSVLSRNLGRQQFKTAEAVLLKRMEQLAVEFQNPAVYVQEFLDIKQTPDEGIRHFLSRLKGVAEHCEFSVDSVCVCKKKVSYSDSLIKFKLVSGLLDREIKVDILGADDKLLEETVKAIEAKESNEKE